jgi:hypothetical protein
LIDFFFFFFFFCDFIFSSPDVPRARPERVVEPLIKHFALPVKDVCLGSACRAGAAVDTVDVGEPLIDAALDELEARDWPRFGMRAAKDCVPGKIGYGGRGSLATADLNFEDIYTHILRG